MKNNPSSPKWEQLLQVCTCTLTLTVKGTKPAPKVKLVIPPYTPKKPPEKSGTAKKLDLLKHSGSEVVGQIKIFVIQQKNLLNTGEKNTAIQKLMALSEVILVM